MELGVYSFAEVPDGTAPSAAQRLQDLLEEIVLADQLGLHVFGVGEQHRPDFSVSAPAVVLAAAAARTPRIRLTSAVSALSSEDRERSHALRGDASSALERSGRLSAPHPGPAARVNRLRWRPAVGGARGHA